MKKILACSVSIFLFVSFCMAQAGRVKKSVFIIVDGISSDVIEKLAPPDLEALKKTGGYTKAYVGGVKDSYSQTPTISAVGYNSVLTGTWVNKHNVWDNDIAAPNYQYHTIFRYLKEQYPQKKTAIFSTWLDNRTKLVGDSVAATGNIAVDYHFDGLELDTVNYAHDKKREYLNKIDSTVASHAAESIRTIAPDLSWVYLEFTDDMGHAFGDGPEFHKAIMDAGKRVGAIAEAVKYREENFNEDWLIIVTTDHGRDAVKGKGHGGQSDRERSSWIFTNAKPLNAAFAAPYASVVDIMPTIARHMNIAIPKENAWELDGFPFIGKLSFINPSFVADGSKIKINWKPMDASGELKVWLATSNNFKTGGPDKYELVKTFQSQSGSAVIDVSDKPSAFYKVVLQGQYNTANGWVLKDK